MKLAYTMSGGGPLIKQYFVGAHVTTAGIPMLQAAAGDYGLIAASVSGAANFVGVSLDTSGSGTLTTKGNTTSMSEGLTGVISVILNPSAVYKIRLAGSATTGAALVQTTNITADTNALTTTITSGDPVPNSPEMDEGTIVCIAGANVGLKRKIDSTTATTAVVEMPFPYTIAVGDIFIVTPATMFPDVKATVQLTTLLDEADASAAWSGDADIRTIGLDFDNSSTTDAKNNSWLYGVFGDSIFTN